ncbi:Putative SOS response-associated peptidase YedK [Maribacter sedimenticola]|uniref:Abasic site processing protein n=1 Tax=Maribacter sedimenticola TaxID=228956 RepID=A0ABY1SIV3_9FLAO|nr:SOS response-associated peptidase family protein [Maribacter sedimenticola]SNR59561.1 Putative SOS response-associated peptidase YedK [Maribacter sedimenticola]
MNKESSIFLSTLPIKKAISMYYKLSNTAKIEQLEHEAGALFKYPILYEPQVVVSGLSEVSIPIITMEQRTTISLAIWGMLPGDFQEDWELFQKLTNTLNVHINTLQSNLWFKDSLLEKRCLIPVTGYFTSLLRDGEIYPYFIKTEDDSILFLAGIYTVLEDGFKTCAIITGPSNDYVKKYQNLVDFMPLTIDKTEKDSWLDPEISKEQVLDLLKTDDVKKLSANPIAKGLFDQDISYDSMLMPNEHPDI